MRRVEAFAVARLAVAGPIGFVNHTRRARRLDFTRAASRALALFIAATILNLSAAFAYASPVARKRAVEMRLMGVLTRATGGVTVDGSPAVSGQTIFSGSAFVTARNSLSTLSLGNLGRVELAPDTSLVLDFSGASVTGSLDAGRVRVYAPSGLLASVTTPDASVACDNTSGQPAVFSVAIESGVTNVSVQTGRVEVRAASGAVQRLSAGESYSSAQTQQQDSPPQQNLSGKKRNGLFLTIAAAVAVVIIVLTGRDDEKIPNNGCEPGPVILSGQSEPRCL
jgi:ferric-dicitrate binding protein FerR (iron transport regulator)